MKGTNVTKFSLSVAYIAGNTFGFGILTGTSANMVALGVIKQVTGVTLYWMQWAKWFFVPCTLSTLIAIYILYKMYPPEKRHVDGGQAKVHQDLAAMGKITTRELRTALYLGLALLLWVTDTWHHIPPWAVAIFVGALMNCPGIGCLEISDFKKVPFGICLFSAGTISLGIVMAETGVSTWIGKAILGHLIKPGMSTSVTSAITFLVSCVMHFPLMESKTAIAGMVPVVAGYFHAMGMPFMGPTLLCTIAGISIAFVPFMVLPSVLMIGFGPHFSYRHCAVTVSVYSVVVIVIQLISCFTWYRWTGLM
jgi:di/tricarboxylate transporter